MRHVGIVVNDLEKSIHFWQELMGFTVISNNIEPSPYIEELLSMEPVTLRTVKFSDASGIVIELLKFIPQKGEPIWKGDLSTTGLTHIAITVKNIEEIVKKLINFNFYKLSKIMTSPDSKVNVVFIHGPENLKLELVEELL